MGEDYIPQAVQEFLLSRIDSIAQLEALLLLYGERGRAWDCPEIARRLYISEATCTEVLTALSRHALVIKDGTSFRFNDQEPELAKTIQRLSEHYAKHLIPVTNLIHSKPRRIHEFAKAFKLKE